jgi:cell wall assembly regulator SMI1
MENLWKRIEEALAQIDPDLLEDLRPGASEDAIERVERQLGVRFPDDYRASLRIHEGTGGFLIDHWELNQLSATVRRWKMFDEFVSTGEIRLGDDRYARATGPVRPQRWNRAWIPIARDGNGNDQALDLDPPANGARGQIIEYYRDSNEVKVIAPGFAGYLERFATDLEAGCYEAQRAGAIVVDLVRKPST